MNKAKHLKASKWCALGLTVLLLIMWSGSYFKYMNFWHSLETSLGMGKGALLVSHYNHLWKPSHPGDIYNAVPDEAMVVGPLTMWKSVRGHCGISLQLWLPFVGAACAAGYLWFKDSKARTIARMGSCVKCGYDLRGHSIAGVCPECGTKK